MPKIKPEERTESKMSSIDFAQHALRDHLAPSFLGGAGTRLQHATRELLKRNTHNKRQGRPEPWTPNRVKDVWYADRRISINAEELRDLEEMTGLRYGRQEIREIDAFISRAETLLADEGENLHRPFLAAMRAFFGASHRS